MEIIIRPEKFETLKAILLERNISGMMVSNVMGHGNQYGYTKQYRGNVYSVNLVNKMKVEVIVLDEVVEDVLSEIHKQIATGTVGDGKVFVYDVLDVMRIRTGDRGEKAL